MTRRALLLAALLLPIATFAQDVQLSLSVDGARADANAGTVPGRVKIANPSASAANAIELTFGFFAGEVLVSDPNWTCSAFRCKRDSLAPQSEVTLDFTLRFPEKAGRTTLFVFVAYHFTPAERRGADARADIVLARPFVVRTTADSGEGSLRDAITRLSADPVCAAQPCRISFAIEEKSARGWHTIEVHSPLPPVTGGDVEIDGTTAEDTNPLGPEIQLLGVDLREGDGLDVRAQRALIRGLAIGYFAGNGIRFVPAAPYSTNVVIEKNYVGVDPTGSHALLNLGRGITIEKGQVIDSVIRDNVLSGNFRSGVFALLDGRGLLLRSALTITRNRIGVAAHSDAPIPNGASGIFLGPEASEALVSENVIAHNAHFGVSIALGAEYIRVTGNRMFSNALLGIDIALDGPTPELRDFFNAVPAIDSAKYDAATNTTTITGRGRPPAHGFYGFRVELYANDAVDSEGYAETEQVLGIAPIDFDGKFTFTASGDLRGKWVNAVTIRSLNFDGSLVFDTSELSKAIRVE